MKGRSEVLIEASGRRWLYETHKLGRHLVTEVRELEEISPGFWGWNIFGAWGAVLERSGRRATDLAVKMQHAAHRGRALDLVTARAAELPSVLS